MTNQKCSCIIPVTKQQRKEAAEVYVRENTTELVDPLDAKKKIEELAEKKRGFSQRTGHTDKSVEIIETIKKRA